MLRPASLCCSLRWCWSCPFACSIAPFVFSLSPFCLPSSSLFENIFENKPRAGLGCVFSKGKGSSKFLREVDDKIGNFLPSQVRDAGIQAVASVAAISGFFNVCGCAAVALASAFAYLCASDVGISAASCVCVRVHISLEGTTLLSGFSAFGFVISAAAAFSDAVTLVSGSACLSAAVFCIALATEAARSALVRFLCLLLDLMPSWTWGVLGLRLRVCCDTSLVSQLVSWGFRLPGRFRIVCAF